MPLINCKDKRNTCGVPLPSTCVGYEGALVGILENENFECNVNIDDVVERLSVIIGALKIKLDSTANQVALDAVEITKLISSLSEIKSQIASLTAEDITVSMDLGCLEADAAPCRIGTNKYTIGSILRLFKDEICLLKA